MKMAQLINKLFESMDSQYIQENDYEIIHLLKQAADALEKLSSENRQLVQQISVLQEERDAAVKDLMNVFWDDEVCNYCKYKHHCEDEKCSEYIEGKGCYDEDSRYFDWKWSCRDFDWGTCAKLENTPCNGCDLINHFEWRGVQENE